MLARRRFAALLAAGALFAIPMVGCGGDDDDNGEETEAATTAPAAPGGGEKVDLSATEYKFDPSDPSVKAGTVTFNVTNDGQVTHALEVEGPDEEQETGDIAAGESAQLTVDLSKPGTYEFYCPIDDHKGLGMEGEITVK